MTKSDLIDLLCEAQKMPKGRAELLINAIFDCMEASLRRGERIEIRGFGSFEIRNYRSYEGRNPRTGSAVSVKPKRLPFFKVGKELKERVNAAPDSAPDGAGSTRAATAKKTVAGNGNGAQPAPDNGGNGAGKSALSPDGNGNDNGAAASNSAASSTSKSSGPAANIHRAANA
jgi:integration host factor subunit beta